MSLCYSWLGKLHVPKNAAPLPPVRDPQDDGARIRIWTSQSLAVGGIAHPALAYDPDHPPAYSQDHPLAYDLGAPVGDIEMQRYTLQTEGEACVQKA